MCKIYNHYEKVTSNEGPAALDNRALAQGLAKVRLSIPSMAAVAWDLVQRMGTARRVARHKTAYYIYNY